MDDASTAGHRRPSPREPGRAVEALHFLALTLAVIAIAATSNNDKWRIPDLLVIATFAAASDLMAVHSGSPKVSISGSFLGIILAVVLLGGGPGAFVGVLAISIGWLRSREPRASAAQQPGDLRVVPAAGRLLLLRRRAVHRDRAIGAGLLPDRVRGVRARAGAQLRVRRELPVLPERFPDLPVGPRCLGSGSAGGAVLGAAHDGCRVPGLPARDHRTCAVRDRVRDLPVPRWRAAEVQAAQRGAASGL